MRARSHRPAYIGNVATGFVVLAMAVCLGIVAAPLVRAAAAALKAAS